MRVTLNLAQDFKWTIIIPEKLNSTLSLNYQVYLDLIPLDKLFVHEQLKTEPDISTPHGEIERLKESINTNGFLHPVLTTYHPLPDDLWVIADGTHRFQVMKYLKSRWIIGMVLQPGSYKRDVWVKTFPTFPSNIPSLDSFFNLLSPKDKKLISIEEIKPKIWNLTKLSISQLEFSQSLIGIYKKGDQIVCLINKSPKNRFRHLKIINNLDKAINVSNKIYIPKSEINRTEHDFLLLPPPLDKQNDLHYLVNNPSLRRIKGSRTIITNRIIHLPIPFEVLQKSRNDSLNAIHSIISNYIRNGEFGSIILKKRYSKSLDISWYDHNLLIGSKNSFFQDASSKEQKALEENFLPMRT
ncbi:MAG: hypothetical protein ACXAC7_01635 [Candidatus Hodarchaeales archaeon]